jgi:hypothetical protein
MHRRSFHLPVHVLTRGELRTQLRLDGYSRLVISCGKHPAGVGFAVDPSDVAAYPASGDCQAASVSVTYRSTAASSVGKKWSGSMVRVSS